ncbi:phosphotransferase family protein [Pleomorphomonas koreensis]|uniref:phosphotransferase family protein n=1 Tax=Pleomorphomonas koreensis TaxID=257440 RepID=UPI0004051214|nr:aminoglycoside phosphotransferase family protein [Pleomorphomonas koreensis]
MVEIGRRLGAGKEAEVYEYGGLALKLYPSQASKAAVFREAANLALLERLALPTPRVHAAGEYGCRWGLVMDRAAGPSFAERMMAGHRLPCLEEMARLHRDLHERPGSGLPSLKAPLSANIRRTNLLDAASRDRLLSQLDALPDGDRLCHGDLHPWNIHGDGEDVMILDWLDACAGPPAADVCRSYLLIRPVDPATATDYVDTYSRLTGLPVADIMAWLPSIAAARLAEGVPAETESLLRLAGLTPAAG